MDKCISDTNRRWISVLTQHNASREKEFAEILDKSMSVGNAIMEYRRTLYEQGRGQVNVESLIEAVELNDLGKARALLEELFLEYIPDDSIKIMLARMERKGLTMNDIYTKHNVNKRLRFLSVY